MQPWRQAVHPRHPCLVLLHATAGIDCRLLACLLSWDSPPLRSSLICLLILGAIDAPLGAGHVCGEEPLRSSYNIYEIKNNPQLLFGAQLFTCVQAMFAEKNPGGPTLGGIFNQCSHNKSRVTMQNSLVAERVRLPCAGNT